MTDRVALLRTVLAAPDDDAPRLIYADWLDERGDADRADLIRAQIELARGDTKIHGRAEYRYQTRVGWDAARQTGLFVPCGCRLCTARAREAALLRPGGEGGHRDCPRADWAGGPVRALTEGWAWERGFVARVWARMDEWADHGDEVLAAQPVRRVVLLTWPEFTASRDRRSGRLAATVRHGGTTPPSVAGVGRTEAAAVAAALGERWPVAFELPEGPEFRWANPYTVALPRGLRAQLLPPDDADEL